ncbi:hypothetical protein ABGB18_32895 [Nonomuraea sp. B12E4]|uniref:hypothetical protein n=1 Tax=Nonomuraea sp. B12E4 TaxID=3153564 RepID=UPI00325F4C5C
MGLDLNFVPDIVKHLALPLAGQAFPEAEPGDIVATADRLESLANILDRIKAVDSDFIFRLLRDEAWQGEAKGAFEKVFAQLSGNDGATAPPSGDALLDQIKNVLRAEAASLREHGVRMEHTQWMIYAALALLAFAIIRLLVWVYVNGPAVFALINQRALMTRASIAALKRNVLMGMLKFGALMGGLDLAVQTAQMSPLGHRDPGDYDFVSLATSTVGGLLTGGLFGGLNAGLSRLASREMVYIASRAELSVRDKLAAMSQSLYGQALVGGVSGTVGSIPGLALSGNLDSSHLFYSLVSGVAGGLDVPAGARVSYYPLPAGELSGPSTGSHGAPFGDGPPTLPRAGDPPSGAAAVPDSPAQTRGTTLTQSHPPVQEHPQTVVPDRGAAEPVRIDNNTVVYPGRTAEVRFNGPDQVVTGRTGHGQVIEGEVVRRTDVPAPGGARQPQPHLPPPAAVPPRTPEHLPPAHTGQGERPQLPAPERAAQNLPDTRAAATRQVPAEQTPLTPSPQRIDALINRGADEAQAPVTPSAHRVESTTESGGNPQGTVPPRTPASTTEAAADVGRPYLPDPARAAEQGTPNPAPAAHPVPRQAEPPTGRISELLQVPPPLGTLGPAGQRGVPAHLPPGVRDDGAAIVPAAQPEIHPPRYVDIGAFGEMVLHRVQPPADAQAAARQWAGGLPIGMWRARAEIEKWLAELLSDDDRDTWTDLFQRGATLPVNGKVLYFKPEVGGFRHLPNPDGPRQYGVSFGGDGVEARTSRSGERQMTAGKVEIFDNSDEAESLASPGLGIKQTSRENSAAGTEIMSGRKTVAYQHDFFGADVSIKVYSDGVEVPHGGRVPDLSVVMPFPHEFRREGPLTADDRPSPMPKYEVPPGAARRIPDHGVIVTALDTTPLVLEVQRRALEAGIPPREVVKLTNELISAVHSEQAMKNRSQWWLTSGSASEGMRFKSSALRSSEGAFRVTGEVVRMEPVEKTRAEPIETRVRDDLGRRTTSTETHQHGNTLNLRFGGKLGYSDMLYARAAGTFHLGAAHSTAVSGGDLPKVTLVESTGVTLYDSVVRLHLTSDSLGAFQVDTRMEVALPVRETSRFERDVFGRELVPPSAEAARLREQPAQAGENLAQVSSRPIIRFEVPIQPARAQRPAYEPHPQEPATLAAGRGPGLGTLARMPQGENLVRSVRNALTWAVPDLPEKVLWQVLRDVDANFGRPALEADVGHLLHGIDYQTAAGRYRIEISARGALGELRGVEEYPLTVNERRLTAAGAHTGRSTSIGGGIELAGNARIHLGEVMQYDAVKLGLHGTREATNKVGFASHHSIYYRTETEGMVTAFRRELPIDVDLRVTKSGTEVANISWPVDGVTAEIVVPHQHLPETPLSSKDAADVGRVVRLDDRPGDVVPLGGRVAGVFRVGAVRELAMELATVHAEWAGLPTPTWRDVPPEIRAATRPSAIEANIRRLTSEEGLTIRLPDREGRPGEMRVRVDLAGLEHVKSQEGVEYEQYTNANSRIVTGQGTKTGVEGYVHTGLRAKFGHVDQDPATNQGGGGSSRKIVGAGGAHFGAKHTSGSSAYEGGIDVARATYGGESHWYRGDLSVTATWKDGAGDLGPTAHLRVEKIADLMVPDRLARHLGLEGPSGTVPPVSEHRAYVAVEPAMNSAFVEHLDAKSVLPEVVKVLREQGALPGNKDEPLIMELLHAQYGEDALSTKLIGLQHGVTTWLPVRRPHGFTEYVGIRVKGTVLDGTHTAERPDVRLMLRSELATGSGTVRETESTKGAKALMRFSRQTEDNYTGGEAMAKRGTASEATDTHATNVKDINRVQTYDPSHEFTHPVQFDIEVVRSKEPPPGLGHLLRGTENLLRQWDRLTNGSAEQLWNKHRGPSTAHSLTGGEVRLLVPEHLTVPVAEGTPVTGRSVIVGEAPRWSRPVEPLSVNAALREVANQVAIPAADLIPEWAPVAALPPKSRGPVPSLSDRPAGYELSRPRGMLLAEAGNPRTVRAQLNALLAHEHVVPGLGSEKIRVGINVHRAQEIAGASVKQRLYTQTMTTSGHGQGHSRDLHGRVGLSRGQGTEGAGNAGWEVGRGSGTDMASRNGNIRERNREMSTDTKYYECAISLVFHGPGRDLVIDVPNGLHIRLTPDDVEMLEREYPGFIFGPPKNEPLSPGSQVADRPEPEPGEERPGAD